MPLTPEEFLGFDSAACPVCGGEVCNTAPDCVIVGGAVDEMPGLLLKARCAECHSTWTETFKPTGYTDLEPSEQGLPEIVSASVRNAAAEHAAKGSDPSPATAGEWLSGIEDCLSASLRSLQCNEVLPRDVAARIHFITECLEVVAFLRKAGVDTKEVKARGVET